MKHPGRFLFMFFGSACGMLPIYACCLKLELSLPICIVLCSLNAGMPIAAYLFAIDEK